MGLHVSMRSWNVFESLPISSRKIETSHTVWDFVRHHPAQASTLQTFLRELMPGTRDAICCWCWWWTQHKQVSLVLLDTPFQGQNLWSFGQGEQSPDHLQWVRNLNTCDVSRVRLLDSGGMRFCVWSEHFFFQGIDVHRLQAWCGNLIL